MRRLTLALTVAIAAAGCGAEGDGDGGDGGPPTEVIAVLPAALVLGPNQQAGLQAVFTPGGADTHVTWTATGGTIDETGLYTAGSTVGTYSARATSVIAPSVYGEAVVTIADPWGVNIVEPGTVTACAPLRIEAHATGGSVDEVVWTMPDPTCGTITQDGPNFGIFKSARGAGGCAVRASHGVSNNYWREVIVTVLPEEVLSINLTPGVPTVAPGAPVAFRAEVSTTCGSFAAGM